MATQNEHIDWAEKNEQFAARLDCSDHVQAGWAITAVFYAALHYVDAYFVSHSPHRRPIDHLERNDWIEESDHLGAIKPMYRRLKDMSTQARYELAHYSEPEYLKALKLLEKVRSHVLAYRRR